MKKLVTFALSAACVCALALGIAACGDDNDDAHTHKLMKVDAVSATFLRTATVSIIPATAANIFPTAKARTKYKKTLG